MGPMSDPDGTEAQPVAAPGAPTLIRVALILLQVVGLGAFLFTFPTILSPGDTRCRLGRTIVETANRDSRPWRHVEVAGVKPADLPCADALRLAGAVRLNEKGDRRASVPGESALRVEGGLAAAVGIGQAVSGWLTLRTLGRRARTAVIAFSAFSAVGPAGQSLGILALIPFVFGIYALRFSPLSRQIWPREPRQPRWKAGGGR